MLESSNQLVKKLGIYLAFREGFLEKLDTRSQIPLYGSCCLKSF